MRSPLTRPFAAALGCLFVLLGTSSNGAASAADLSPNYVPISGAGSTWSSNAIQSWQANVAANGMNVNYADTGSSDGRNQFKSGTVDFAVSEIPYGVADNGVIDPLPTRPFSYLPIVAGGTSFMYHLDSGGKRITNLRLDGQTLTKIFTANITMWNSPEIQAENPGISLPARRIVPIVRQDGSGTTAQFSAWMASEYGSIWDAFCHTAGRTATPCGTTSFFPVPSNSSFVQATGSTGVAGYVAQDTGEGAITYVEYSYARNAGFPVAKVLNKAGYYTQPTQYNVAVALQGAVIDPTDLTQKLAGVYHNTDQRTYPLSSYSYMIVPTSTQAPFSLAKGLTLGDFAYYFLCAGQRNVGDLGYSPLPINLVQAGFDVIKKVPGVNVQNIDITKCQNPTFTTNGTNNLANIAKYPPPCDKQGASQCAADGVTSVPSGGSTSGGGSANGGSTSGGTAGSSTSGGVSGGTASGGSSGGFAGGTGSGGATAGTAGGTTAGSAPGSTPGVGVSTDPDTGKVISAIGVTSGGGASGGSGNPQPIADAVSVGSGISSTFEKVLMGLAAALLLGIAIGPPILSRRLARRGADRDQL